MNDLHDNINFASVLDTTQQAQTLSTLFTNITGGDGLLNGKTISDALNLTANYINDGKNSSDVSKNKNLATPLLNTIINIKDSITDLAGQLENCETLISDTLLLTVKGAIEGNCYFLFVLNW